jgi:hypothetical protein
MTYLTTSLIVPLVLIVLDCSISDCSPAAAGELLANEVKRSSAASSQLAEPASGPADKLEGASGFAPSQSPSPKRPEDPQPPARLIAGQRGIKIIFGGALCPVCLIAFERRLKTIDGITFARVEKLPEKAKTGHPPKKAIAMIFYDSAKITRQTLITLIRQNDFQFLRATDLDPADQVEH